MAVSRSSRPPSSRSFALALAAAVGWAALLAYGAVPRPAMAEESSESALKPGAWAAEFELDPEYRYAFGISSGVILSAKRHFSARSALRFGAGASFDESMADGETSYVHYSPYYIPNYRSAAGIGESHSESQSYTLFLHYLRYHPEHHAVAIFWEVGPSVRYVGSDHHEEVTFAGPAPTDPTEWDTSDRALVRRVVALDLNLGFEWFFNRRLSLGARVGVWGGYGWGTDTDTYETTTSDNSYYSRNLGRNEVEQVTAGMSPATVLFSAYF